MSQVDLDDEMLNNILIVEDEATLLETLTYNLEREGYGVTSVSDGLSAIEVARKNRPDLIILDVMLPGLDGFDVTRVLRQEMNIPILMLTARDDEIDRVLGLELGADDYLTKPFSMRELKARIKAHLRRVRLIREESQNSAKTKDDTYIFENLNINLTRREVHLDKQILPLKPKEYELLLFLGKHQGKVLSRDLLLERVWGWDFSGGSRTVDVHIRWLREKIEDNPAQPKRIITIRGVGYRFEG
jgi:DNA-binding response OmpR family regulator